MFSPRFRDQMSSNEIFVQRDPQTGFVGHGNPAVDGLNSFLGQLVPQWRIFDAVFEQERVTAGA
jgi:hypothetical protein